MAETGFHFAQPWWLSALLVLPFVAWWLRRSAERAAHAPIHLYADPHLLPHLTGTRELQPRERWGRFALWALMWTLGTLALAGPRWDYEEVHLFEPGNNLLILLDISRSMETADVAPTRLVRAKQEIQDLLNQNRTLRIGLIAFASIPHVVAPVTQDTQTIANALPALDTRLAQLPGSRLVNALDRARTLLAALPADSAKSLLLISDGDFDEPGLSEAVRKLAAQGIHFDVLGVGTSEGGPVPDLRGGLLTGSDGRTITSRLNEALLQGLAEAGHGVYRLADYKDDDTRDLLEAATLKPPKAADSEGTTRVWNERFYLLTIPLMLMLLPLFRRAHPQRKAA